MIQCLKPQKKLIVGMSGNIWTLSVSAWLLQQQGYQVEGLFMKNWEEDDGEEYCTAAANIGLMPRLSATSSALNCAPVNFAAQYWDNIRTVPLPNVRKPSARKCGYSVDEIKLKAFLEFAAEDLGADYIATGHFVRRADVNGERAACCVVCDSNKDQSYFLYSLSHEQIAQSLFPVGELEKVLAGA
ncbi:hypothetical protein ACLK1X_06505 [Escherichia coli]